MKKRVMLPIAYKFSFIFLNSKNTKKKKKKKKRILIITSKSFKETKA